MFLQIAEIQISDVDAAIGAIVASETEWRSATVGRRTALVERLYVDRDRPGIYFAVNEFPSHELAMVNSNLPETSALAEAVGGFVDDVVGYRNLDLVLDMREEEFAALADAVLRVFDSGLIDDVLFVDDVLFDVNVPDWRFQVAGRAEVAKMVNENSPEGNDVEASRLVVTSTGFLMEIVTRGRGEVGGLSRQLCLVNVDRGRITSVVIYCTGVWNADLEARHAREVSLIDPAFV